jgi:hypothetical protein
MITRGRMIIGPAYYQLPKEDTEKFLYQAVELGFDREKAKQILSDELELSRRSNTSREYAFDRALRVIKRLVQTSSG